MCDHPVRPLHRLLTVLVTLALGATADTATGTERHAAAAWLVLEFDSPAAVLELVREHLGAPAAMSLTRLLPAPVPVSAEPMDAVPEIAPGAAVPATWYLDLEAPATVGYAWFPAAHTLVGQVIDPDAVARQLGMQVDSHDVERTVGGIRLFPLGHVVGALRDDWLVVADDVELAHHLAGTLTAGRPASASRQDTSPPAVATHGVALPLRVELRLHRARQAVAPLLVRRKDDEIETWPIAGPVSRQRLAIGALLHRIPAQLELGSLEAFVTSTALVLNCAAAAGNSRANDSPREHLVLTGTGSTFHAAVHSLPFVAAALNMAQEAGSVARRLAGLETVAAAESDRAFRVAVTQDGRWHVGTPVEPFPSWTADGFLLEWAGVRLFHDGTPGTGGPCVSLTPAGLENIAARLNPRPAPHRHR